MATAQSELIAEPTTHLWTVDEYYQMAEIGLFDGKRVELLEGEVIEMSPIGRPHVIAVKRTSDILEAIFSDGWFVQTQAPIRFGKRVEPEPDVAVIKGEMNDYETEHPSTADLIVEVSDNTLYYDRNSKASSYAKAGIQDYWIINLKKRQLEVFRRPVADSEAKYGFNYADRLTYFEGESISPLVKPEVVIAVGDLLPPQSRKDEKGETYA